MNDRLSVVFLGSFIVSSAMIVLAALIPGDSSGIEQVVFYIGMVATGLMLSFILLTLALLIWDGIAALIKRR